MRILLAPVLVTALSACGGGGGGSTPGFSTASSSLLGLSGMSAGSVTQSDMNAMLAALSPTPIADLPTGSATYSGLYSGMTLVGGSSFVVQYGDASVNIDFAADTGTLNMSGAVSASLPGTLVGNNISNTDPTNSWDGTVTGPEGEIVWGSVTLNQGQPDEFFGSFITER